MTLARITRLFQSDSFFFFFFRLFPSGVATADFPSPVVPIFCILLRHFNLSLVLFHHIHKPPSWPSPFPLSWQLHPQHPSPNIPIIFPPYMSIPPQSRLSCFLSKPSHLCCPSDVLIPDFAILVTPNENRNIFNSATSISASCLFVSATVSNPYNVAGFTATLYTFPFTLADTRLSQIIPDIFLQPFHPACTLFFTSLLHPPLLCTVEPR